LVGCRRSADQDRRDRSVVGRKTLRLRGLGDGRTKAECWR
jgi:hypothetical protein